jgi:hypothetical protein
MGYFVWVLPLMLLLSVVIVAYFLGLVQDKANKVALNNTEYIDKVEPVEKVNTDKSYNARNTLTNSSQDIIK